ncbi:MAG TPA: prephenate dehydrogenase/arogenate dehydrogenase family protein, partial [Telluria sp.]
MFSRVVIVGVGLIGGSFALGLKAARAAGTIVGLERSAQALARAQELGIIDVACTDPQQALKGADLVLLAAPVAQTGAILKQLLPFLEPHTIVSDAGSTKSDVVASARAALGERIGQFVPGHPIAGRESNGPDAAIPDLFRGKKAVLTPLPENSPDMVERVAAAWRACGAIIHMLTPQEHD